MGKTYVVSDIHGCLNEFLLLMEMIQFTKEDQLYVLGDAMDRGPEPVRVLQEIMRRPNVHYLLGNHDMLLLESFYTGDFESWLADGGRTTAKQLQALSDDDLDAILDFLLKAPTYYIIEYDDKVFVLVHAGIGGFIPDKPMDDYPSEELLWERTDYTRPLFPDECMVLVTGHTPTQLIRKDQQPLVFEENGHIAIDCGCVFGGQLAAYCLETGEVTYVKAGGSE